MSQNMKNFSEILDTDHHIGLDIKIRPVSLNGDPIATVEVNGKVLHTGKVTECMTLSAQLGLLDPPVISIKLQNKIYHATRETALVIESITVDQINIVDHCYGNIVYHNDQNQSIQSMYLGFNGVWIIRLPEPFYRWWHRASGQGWLLEPSYSISS